MSRSQLGRARGVAFAVVVTVGGGVVVAGSAGCPAPVPRQQPSVGNTAGSPTAGAASVSASEHDALVAAVLERFAAEPGTLPDHGLLPEQGPIYVLLEIGQAPDKVMRIGALPKAERPYVGKTLAELQAEADRSKENVAFVRFYSIAIDGDHADVSSGVDIALPTRPGLIKMCCCLASDKYEKRAGRWTFASRGLQMCS